MLSERLRRMRREAGADLSLAEFATGETHTQDPPTKQRPERDQDQASTGSLAWLRARQQRIRRGANAPSEGRGPQASAGWSLLDGSQRAAAAMAKARPTGRQLSGTNAVLPGVCHEAGWILWQRRLPWPDGLPLTRPEIVALLSTSSCLIDTETTGLSGGVGSYAFMLGCLEPREDGLRLSQYYLRHPGGEAGMLRAAAKHFGPGVRVVSYNGRSFDWPLLVSRARLLRLEGFPVPEQHVDMLHEARRVWQGRLPDFRLQTVTGQCLGIHRVDDLPGDLAPQSWRAWLRGGHSDGLIQVLEHNRRDLVSLAALWLVVMAFHDHNIELTCDHPRPAFQQLA